MAKPPGRVAAASDDVEPWLRPWVKDECEGASVDDVLGLLAKVARDPSLYDWDKLAARLVVHPQELIDYNRGHLSATREAGETWILRHDDGRLPLRVNQRGDRYELVAPIIDDASLAGVARRSLGALESAMSAAKCSWRPAPAPVWFGAAHGEIAPHGEQRDRVLDPDGDDSMRGLLAVLAAHAGDAAATAVDELFASPFGDEWTGYVAVRDERPIAAVLAGDVEGNAAIAWIGGPPHDRAIASLLHAAVTNAEPGTVTTTITAANMHDVAALGYRRLAAR